MGDCSDDDEAAAALLEVDEEGADGDEKRCSSFFKAFLCVKRSPAPAFVRLAVRDAHRSVYASCAHMSCSC